MVRYLSLILFSASLWGDSVAVLPLFNQSVSNQSKASNLDWIGESVAETIRESISGQGLLVHSREDRIEVYRRLSIRPNAVLTHASVMKIGETLDADQVVFGQFEVTPEQPGGKRTLKLSARVINLKRVREGLELQESGPLEELSALQTHLAWQVVRELEPQSAPSERDFLKARVPVRIDAVENYIRGLMAALPEQQQRFFLQAARLDGHYSEPCFQLGRIFWGKKDYRSAAQWLGRVSSADSHYMEALFLLGLSRYYDGDFENAARQFATVAAAVPLNEVYNDLGAAQSRQNAPDALANFKKALEGDEADPDYWFNVGYANWKSGQFTTAADDFRAVLARTPADSEATLLLGRSLQAEGPRPGETRLEGRERLKHNFEETAFRELQAELRSKP